MNRHLPLLIIVFLIICFSLLGLVMIYQAPEVSRLGALTVYAKPDHDAAKKGALIGREALGQHHGASGAESTHVKVRWDTKTQAWELQNVAHFKRVDARTDRLPTRYLRRLALQAGDTIETEHFTLQVKQADFNRLMLLDEQEVSSYWDGSSLVFSDNRTLYSACEHRWPLYLARQLKDEVFWRWRRQDNKDETRLFTIGGQVDCTSRLKQKGSPPDSLRIYWMDNRYWLGLGENSSVTRIKRGNEWLDLKKTPLQVKGEDGRVQRLIIGRTHYDLKTSSQPSTQKTGEPWLTLVPTFNQPVFIKRASENKEHEPEGNDKNEVNEAELALKKQWDKMGIDPRFVDYAWIGAIPASKSIGKSNLAITLVITFVLTVLAMKSSKLDSPKSRLLTFLSALFVSLIVLASIVLVYLDSSLSTLLTMALAMAIIATLVQYFSGLLLGMAAWVWGLAIALSAIGLLVLMQLAVGSSNTRWLGFPSETAFWITQIYAWVALASLVSPENLFKPLILLFNPDIRSRVHIGRYYFPHISYTFLVILAVCLLLAQWWFGAEEGVFGVQPVELVKWVFVLAMARLLWYWWNIRSLQSSYYQVNRLGIARGLLFQVILVLVLGVLILVLGVRDNSPVFIVGWLTLALLWLAFIDPLNRGSKAQWFGQGILGIGVGIIIITGIIIYLNPPAYDSQIPQAERLRIWSNPELFPQAASQLIKSLIYSGEGGWLGTGWFGTNGVVMNLPAVQDDFIGAFLINRFGGLAAIMLVTVQIAWLYVLFYLSSRIRAIEAPAQVKTSLTVLALVIYGLAWLHLLHWLISWSNVLGLLPIMGQPMTWLSAGNSHLLALGATTLLLSLLGSWIYQKSQG